MAFRSWKAVCGHRQKAGGRRHSRSRAWTAVRLVGSAATIRTSPKLLPAWAGAGSSTARPTPQRHPHAPVRGRASLIRDRRHPPRQLTVVAMAWQQRQRQRGRSARKRSNWCAARRRRRAARSAWPALACMLARYTSHAPRLSLSRSARVGPSHPRRGRRLRRRLVLGAANSMSTRT
jgi:hypothetical protein